MHEKNSQIPVTGLSPAQPKPARDSLAGSNEQNPPGKPINGASFDASHDDSYAFSSLRKLQDSTKFDKARFSFRLYRR
jgi:hypothetical protein